MTTHSSPCRFAAAATSSPASSRFAGPVTLPPSTLSFDDDDAQESGAFVPTTASLRRLEKEILRSLVRRSLTRTRRDRGRSPTDDLAASVATARAALGAAASAAARRELAEGTLPALDVGFRWCLRVAHELEAIEAADLDGMGDWERLERFAPVAIAAYDQAIDGARAPESAERFHDAGADAQQALDAVCAHFDLALRASILAA